MKSILHTFAPLYSEFVESSYLFIESIVFYVTAYWGTYILFMNVYWVYTVSYTSRLNTPNRAIAIQIKICNLDIEITVLHLILLTSILYIFMTLCIVNTGNYH
jgi:hypothetical protein